jgi:diaminopimelate epimerase
MKLQFTKMHGLGNDFVVVDGINQNVAFSERQWAWLGNRNFGIGADQLLLVEKPTVAGADFRYRIFNNTGGEVEQCGNGARCFVRFVRDKELTDKNHIRVQTMKGIIEPALQANGQVTVDMGAPVFEAPLVPFNPALARAGTQPHTWFIPVDIPENAHGKGVSRDSAAEVLISAISMGNPHAVQVVDNVDTAPVPTQGPLIERHAAFPNRVNAGYLQIVSRSEVRLRVYERGAGETLACGSGACAAVVAGITRGLLDAQVTVHTRGGDLQIAWRGAGQPVMMTGPAVTVFEGTVEVPDL